NPNNTMEEYIRLKEEKSRRHGKVYNWETAKHAKIWYDDDIHDLRSMETKFPAIVFNDKLASEEALPCEPMVSSLNDNEIDFRISLDESDDEDYMGMLFNLIKNLYVLFGIPFDPKQYYKYGVCTRMLRRPRLKEEKSRRHGKVYNWETAKHAKIWYDDDIHDLRSMETKFPAIVFNDKLASEEALPCEPMVSSLNDNEIDFRISLDESDDEDYMIWHLYHHVSRGTHSLGTMEYSDQDITNFKERLGRIHDMDMHRI
nr:hypothetical protein [Tanacetum cinerariifolium]